MTANANKSLKDFKYTFTDDIQKDACLQDMLRMNKLHVFDFAEYLYYHFYNRKEHERLSFISDWEHLGYACVMNRAENNQVFDNKWLTYCRYKKFFGREIIVCQNSADYEKFEQFLTKYVDVIIKPLEASCGNGVQILRGDEVYVRKEEYWKKLIDAYPGGFIVEELIKQVSEMAEFHPKSVNTVRIATIRCDDETIIFHPCMRMGLNGNHVDNGGAGRIICAVNVKTGRLSSAADEWGHEFTDHPDSNRKIIDFVIPRWDEAKIFAKELA